MQLQGQSKLLRIFLGEADRLGHQLLYEAIILAAKEKGLAGGTVLKGIMSYGASSRIHRARLIELSEDMPIVVEIVDHADKIDAFLDTVNDLFEQCGKGGLITVEKVDVLYYKAKNKEL
jgi:PII-like signaling protein